MSESTSAPAAPAATPGVTGSEAAPPPAAAKLPPRSVRRAQALAGSAPPPSQAAPQGQLGTRTGPPQGPQGISVSEAARMLSQQRRQGEPPAPTAPQRKAAPNDVAAASAQSPAPAPAARPGEQAASALERALGVNAPAPQSEAAPAVPSAPELGVLVEIEGQKLRTPAEVQEFAQRKSADYTQKMQALAEAGKQIQAQQQALATVLPYIQPELARLAQQVQNVPQRPDPSLADTDPAAYIRQRAAYEQAMEEQGRLGNITQLQQQAQNRAMEAAVAQANEQLGKEFPFWNDPVERGKAQQEIITWATTKGGFSEGELRGLASAHHLKTMMKAAMFDRMMEGARAAPTAPRQAPPARGAAPPPPLAEGIRQAQSNFEDKPNWRNGAALLAARRSGAR